MTERVRFAPSPTGGLHIGGARTALYNWLVARATGGDFILRIEDTDSARFVPGSAEAIERDLRWLGLDWDEGPDTGGPFGPYHQSERAPMYAHTHARLREVGAVYPCFCTAEELDAGRDAAVAAGRAPRYSGGCGLLDPVEANRRIAAGQPHAWRFRVPPGSAIEWDDAVFGRQSVDRETLSDFVLVRSDGSATYDLACVTDDLAMGITLVLRGQDHLTNTARQLLLYGALGESVPRFGHLPLITGPDGVPLSKSEGSTSISDLAAAGHLPNAVVQHIALLGWSDPDDRQLLEPGDIVAAFSLGRVSTAPAAHDPARLAALTTRHLHSLQPEALVEAVAPFAVGVPGWLDLGSFILSVRQDLVLASDIAPLVESVTGSAVRDSSAREILGSADGQRALEVAGEVLSDSPANAPATGMESALRAAFKVAGIPLKTALPALRSALTGSAHGLRIALLLEWVPRDQARARISRAIGYTSDNVIAIPGALPPEEK